MIAVEPDGTHILLLLEAGLNGVTVRMTENEAIAVHDRLHELLFPAPEPEKGPDE